MQELELKYFPIAVVLFVGVGAFLLLLRPGGITGGVIGVGDDLPSVDYAPPWDLWSQELFLTVPQPAYDELASTGTEGVAILVDRPGAYIHRDFYVSKQEGAASLWERHSFPGGEWRRDAANAIVPYTVAELDGENYVLVYTCKENAQAPDGWDCGCTSTIDGACRAYAIQEFEGPSLPGTPCLSDADCEAPTPLCDTATGECVAAECTPTELPEEVTCGDAVDNDCDDLVDCDDPDCDCAGASCGDGLLDVGEACDDGTGNGPCPATCSEACTLNECASGDPHLAFVSHPFVQESNDLHPGINRVIALHAFTKGAQEYLLVSFGDELGLGAFEQPFTWSETDWYPSIFEALGDDEYHQAKPTACDGCRYGVSGLTWDIGALLFDLGSGTPSFGSVRNFQGSFPDMHTGATATITTFAAGGDEYFFSYGGLMSGSIFRIDSFDELPEVYTWPSGGPDDMSLVRNVVANGPVLYVAASNGLYSLDFTDPAAPVRSQVGAAVPTRHIHGMDLDPSGYLVVAGIDGTRVYDLSQPANPELLSTLEVDLSVFGDSETHGAVAIHYPHVVAQSRIGNTHHLSLYDASTGELLETVDINLLEGYHHEYEGSIHDLAFSRDGAILAVANWNMLTLLKIGAGD